MRLAEGGIASALTGGRDDAEKVHVRSRDEPDCHGPNSSISMDALDNAIGHCRKATDLPPAEGAEPRLRRTTTADPLR